jgi:hypothetical protein
VRTTAELILLAVFRQLNQGRVAPVQIPASDAASGGGENCAHRLHHTVNVGVGQRGS